MRDSRFKVEHSGGSLSAENHLQIARWACNCASHVIPLPGEEPDPGIEQVLITANAWCNGSATVGDARQASLKAIKLANESTNPVSVALARCAGHAAATAHMADHALEAAMYALKAVKLAGRRVEEERKWQNSQLPEEIRDIILSARQEKESHFRL
jgi:hypothetical protein